jgi:predicted secreted protein
LSQAFVNPGDRVKAGQKVGLSGGMNGFHVHVEVAIDAPDKVDWSIALNGGDYFLVEPISALKDAIAGKKPVAYAPRVDIPQPAKFDVSAKVVATADAVPVLQRADRNSSAVRQPLSKGEEFQAVYQVIGDDKQIYWVNDALKQSARRRDEERRMARLTAPTSPRLDFDDRMAGNAESARQLRAGRSARQQRANLSDGFRRQFGKSAALRVDGSADGFQVAGVDAARVATSVVNHQLRRDGADELLVGGPMREAAAIRTGDAAVPVVIDAALPIPASGFCIDNVVVRRDRAPRPMRADVFGPHIAPLPTTAGAEMSSLAILGLHFSDLLYRSGGAVAGSAPTLAGRLVLESFYHE